MRLRNQLVERPPRLLLIRKFFLGVKRSWLYLLLALISASVTAVVLYLTINQKKTEIDSSIDQSALTNISQKDIPAPPSKLDEYLSTTSAKINSEDKQITILLLGYGGAGHDGGYLADAIIVAHIDLNRNALQMIHIPRDLWVEIPVGDTKFPMKINGALAMGTKTSNYPTSSVPKDRILMASTLTKDAVKTVTGLTVDGVVGVDFHGFSQAIDALQGIELSLPSAFEDLWYPVRGKELDLCGHSPEDVTAMSATMSGFILEKQFPCRYEQLRFKAGLNRMNGETALKYSRSRHSSSDFARGLRQVAVILAVMNKLFTLEALENIPNFYNLLTRSLKTDITVEQIIALAPTLKKLPNMDIVEISLNTDNVLKSGISQSGAFILIPKSGMHEWLETHQYIQSQLP